MSEVMFPDVASWPKVLQQRFALHNEQTLKQAGSDSPIPPLATPAASVEDLVGRVLGEMMLQVPEEISECELCVCFIRDLFESCCACSLLSGAERKQVASMKKIGLKRKRKPDFGELSAVSSHYASVLPADYLLRLLVALPAVVGHYIIVNGGRSPPMTGFVEHYSLFLKCLANVIIT